MTDNAECGERRPGTYTSFQTEPFIPDCTLPAGHDGDHCHHHRIRKGDKWYWPRTIQWTAVVE